MSRKVKSVSENTEQTPARTRNVRKSGQAFGRVINTSTALRALAALGITESAFVTAYDSVPRRGGSQGGPRHFNDHEQAAFDGYLQTRDFNALAETVGGIPRATKLIGRAARLGLLS